MHEKPKLQCTRDYDIFEMHPLNRNLCEKPLLLASLKEHGFMPSSPIQCIRNGRGILKVIRGHHRLDYAKRLKLPVWFVVDESNTNLYDLEGDSSARWNVNDFLESRAKSGDLHCAQVLAFRKKHQLTQGAAISLLGGESAGSENGVSKVKRGTFKVSPDLRHAEAVVRVTDYFRECGVTFATQSAFVTAVSLCLRVPECEESILKHRVQQQPGLVQKRTNVADYLNELDALYNHGAKAKRLALAFRAREVSRHRQATFARPARAATKASK